MGLFPAWTLSSYCPWAHCLTLWQRIDVLSASYLKWLSLLAYSRIQGLLSDAVAKSSVETQHLCCEGMASVPAYRCIHKAWYLTGTQQRWTSACLTKGQGQTRRSCWSEVPRCSCKYLTRSSNSGLFEPSNSPELASLSMSPSEWMFHAHCPCLEWRSSWEGERTSGWFSVYRQVEMWPAVAFCFSACS